MTRTIRIWVLLALLAVGTTSLLALPPNEVHWQYYTNASQNVLCGGRSIFCDGSVLTWGCKTPYYVMWSYPCP